MVNPNHKPQITSTLNKASVAEVLRRSAHVYSDKRAVVGKGELSGHLTYEELNSKANQFCHYLKENGVKKGDHVAIVSGNSINWPIFWFGIAKKGGVSVPMDPEFNQEMLTYQLEHGDVEYVIVQEDCQDHVSDAIDTIDSNIKLIYTDDGRLDDIADQQNTEPDVVVGDRDIMQIAHTSGTTSKPKGVMQSHANWVFAALNAHIDLRFDTDTKFFHPFPIFHATAQVFLLGSILTGSTIIYSHDWDPDVTLEAVHDESVNYVWLLPPMYRTILDMDTSDYDLESIEYAGYAMTPMDKETLKRGIKQLDAKFILGSGQTESLAPTPVFPPEYQLEKEGNYWGIPSTFTDAAIMDEGGNLLPPNEIGEIVYRGPTVTEGLYKDEDETRRRTTEGWWRSEDLGFVDEDGLIKFVDRKKDMIKTGGENVPTIRVESAMMEHPDVEEASVFGLNHPRWGEAVTAVVKASDTAEEDIIEFCKDHEGLERYDVPKRVLITDSFPKTGSGKIRKTEMKTNYEGLYEE
jgi:long-chain acyl-CoA synthetase